MTKATTPQHRIKLFVSAFNNLCTTFSAE